MLAGACGLWALAACTSDVAPGSERAAPARGVGLARPRQARGGDVEQRPVVSRERADVSAPAPREASLGVSLRGRDAGAALVGIGGARTSSIAPQRPACCAASDAPGCGDPRVEACACAADGFCCQVAFDESCVVLAESSCDLRCDARAPTGDCCAAVGGPGCADSRVSACICEIDPFCCAFRFDENCVNLGRAYCEASCEAGVAP